MKSLTPDDRRRLREACLTAMRALDAWTDAGRGEQQRQASIALRAANLRWRRLRRELGTELEEWEPATRKRMNTIPQGM